VTSETDLFRRITNAVLDLQAAHLQSYDRPVKTLNSLLNHPDLQEINKRLTDVADFEKLIEESAKTQGGMVGSANLVWPGAVEEDLGLTLLLIRKFAEDPDYMVQFGHMYFYSDSKLISGIHNITSQVIIPFVRDYKAYVLSRGNVSPRLSMPLTNRIFVVHGHDEGARESVARFLERLGFQAVILHEQANKGRTVIEKVEANSDVSFAVVLLTPDDEGAKRGGSPEPRVRQNVLLELGYFIGRLGRDKVCALKRGEVEIPSDFAGVVWETMDAGQGWKQSLARELQAAGHQIDWNEVMK